MPVTLGIVGCGSIAAKRHVPDLAANPAARMVAFCDPVVERAERLAAAHGGVAYGDLDALLAHPGMDAVVIGTPNAFHAAQTIAAVRAGKHVLVEKPMATTRADARAMIDAAAAAGRFLMVGQSQRLAPAHVKAREVLASGRLGRPLTFRTAFKHRGPEHWCVDRSADTWFFKRRLAGMGVCGDLGIHKADLMRYLLGDEIATVQAQIDTHDKRYPDGRPVDVDDNALLLVRTRRGATGTIAVSWTNYGEWEANYTVVYCERGVLMLATDPRFQLVVRFADGTEECHKLGGTGTNDKPAKASGRHVSDAFVESIRTNAPPEIDGGEGYKSLDVILTAFDAHAQGRALPVASADPDAGVGSTAR